MQTGETSARITGGGHTPPPTAPNGASENVEAFAALVRGESGIGDRAETAGAAPAQGTQDFGSIKRARMVRIPPSQPDPADLGTFKTTDYGRFSVGPKEGPLYPVLDAAGNRTEFAVQEKGNALVLGVVHTTAGQASFSEMPQVHQGFSPTDAWDGKFRYGALSALVSSYVVGKVFSGELHKLENHKREPESVRDLIKRMTTTFNNMSPHDVETILDMANTDQFGDIYEANPSVVHTPQQNLLFIEAMARHPELAPVDDRGKGGFSSGNFEFSVHRGLYNQALGIAQNGLAAYVNAYIVGERSLELDVLETLTGDNLTVHDLAINRLTGSYDDQRRMVEHSFPHQLQVGRGMVDPTAERPTVIPTPSNVGTLEDFLDFHNKYLPQATVHLDARNYSTLSSVDEILRASKNRENIVVKSYPFTLKGGFNSILESYASRYTQGNKDTARQHLEAANITVCCGLIHQQADKSFLSDSSFGTARFDALRGQLPCVRKPDGSEPARFTAVQTPLTGIEGVTDYSAAELAAIEDRTYQAFQYICGFVANTNTRVIQLGANISLTDVAEKARRGDQDAVTVLAGLSEEERKGAAVNENLMKLVRMIRAGDLQVHVPADQTTDENARRMTDRFQKVMFGSSDRYPDFAMAIRDEDGRVMQDTLSIWNYYIVAGRIVAAPSGSVVDRTGGSKHIPYDHHDFKYMTTDGMVDLRLAKMDLLGKAGLPDELLYNPNGLVRQVRTPSGPSSPQQGVEPREVVRYNVPVWAKEVDARWTEVNLAGPRRAITGFQSLQRPWELTRKSPAEWAAQDFASATTPALASQPDPTLRGVRFQDGSRAVRFVLNSRHFYEQSWVAGEPETGPEQMVSGFQEHLDRYSANVVAIFFNEAGEAANAMVQKIGGSGSISGDEPPTLLEYDSEQKCWRPVGSYLEAVKGDMGFTVPKCLPPVHARSYDLESVVEAVKTIKHYDRIDAPTWADWMRQPDNWPAPPSPRTRLAARVDDQRGLMFADNSRAVLTTFADTGTDQWNWGQSMRDKFAWVLVDNESRPAYMIVRSTDPGSDPVVYRYDQDYTWRQTHQPPGEGTTQSLAKRAPRIPLGGVGGTANIGAMFPKLSYHLLQAGFAGLDNMPVARLAKIAPLSRDDFGDRGPGPTEGSRSRPRSHIYQMPGEGGRFQHYISPDRGQTFFAVEAPTDQQGIYRSSEDPQVAYRFQGDGVEHPWALELRPSVVFEQAA